MATALVNSESTTLSPIGGGGDPGNNHYSRTLGWNPTLNNVVVAIVHWGVTSEAVTNFADSNANTWGAPDSIQDNPNAISVASFWCKANATGAMTITFQSTTAFNNPRLTVLEFSGAVGTLTANNSLKDLTFSTPHSAGSVTLPAAGGALVSACNAPSVSGAVTEADSGWTTIAGAANADAVAYKAFEVAGTYNPSWTLPGSSGSGALVLAFEATPTPVTRTLSAVLDTVVATGNAAGSFDADINDAAPVENAQTSATSSSAWSVKYWGLGDATFAVPLDDNAVLNPLPGGFAVRSVGFAAAAAAALLMAAPVDELPQAAASTIVDDEAVTAPAPAPSRPPPPIFLLSPSGADDTWLAAAVDDELPGTWLPPPLSLSQAVPAAAYTQSPPDESWFASAVDEDAVQIGAPPPVAWLYAEESAGWLSVAPDELPISASTVVDDDPAWQPAPPTALLLYAEEASQGLAAPPEELGPTFATALDDEVAGAWLPPPLAWPLGARQSSALQVAPDETWLASAVDEAEVLVTPAPPPPQRSPLLGQTVPAEELPPTFATALDDELPGSWLPAPLAWQLAAEQASSLQVAPDDTWLAAAVDEDPILPTPAPPPPWRAPALDLTTTAEELPPTFATVLDDEVPGAWLPAPLSWAQGAEQSSASQTAPDDTWLASAFDDDPAPQPAPPPAVWLYAEEAAGGLTVAPDELPITAAPSTIVDDEAGGWQPAPPPSLLLYAEESSQGFAAPDESWFASAVDEDAQRWPGPWAGATPQVVGVPPDDLPPTFATALDDEVPGAWLPPPAEWSLAPRAAALHVGPDETWLASVIEDDATAPVGCPPIAFRWACPAGGDDDVAPSIVDDEAPVSLAPPPPSVARPLPCVDEDDVASIVDDEAPTLWSPPPRPAGLFAAVALASRDGSDGDAGQLVNTDRHRARLAFGSTAVLQALIAEEIGSTATTRARLEFGGGAALHVRFDEETNSTATQRARLEFSTAAELRARLAFEDT